MSKLLSFSILLAMSGFSLTACNKPADSKDTTQTSVSTTASSVPKVADTDSSKLPATAPTYKMAVEASGQPFTFKGEDGRLTGFDVDLIEAIGERQGFKVETIANPWDSIFNTLDDNSRDIVASGVAITPERQQKMNFSDAYMDSYMAVAFTNPTIKTYEDLQGKKVGVQKGTNYEEFARKNFPTTTTGYSTTFLAYQAMLKGEVDAVIDDVNMVNSQKLRLKADNVQLMRLPNQEADKFAYAIKKGRNDLTQQINEGLKKVKADGTYDKIYTKWFGSIPVVIGNTPASSTAQ